jgi:hypothetical protein
VRRVAQINRLADPRSDLDIERRLGAPTMIKKRCASPKLSPQPRSAAACSFARQFCYTERSFRETSERFKKRG